jgi:hypothetical protein
MILSIDMVLALKVDVNAMQPFNTAGVLVHRVHFLNETY